MKNITDWEDIPTNSSSGINDWEDIPGDDIGTLAKTGASVVDAGLSLAEGVARSPSIGIRTTQGISDTIKGDESQSLPETGSLGADLALSLVSEHPILSYGKRASKGLGDFIANIKQGLRGKNVPESVSQTFKANDITGEKSENAFNQTNIPQAFGVLKPAYESIKNLELQQALSKLSEADYAKAIKLIEAGEWDKVGELISTPGDIIPTIAGAAPTTIASIRGGVPGIAGVEAGSFANDINQFEQNSGKPLTDKQYAKSIIQDTFLNSILEKAGIDRMLGKHGGNPVTNVAKSAVTEGLLTEPLQTLNTNIAKSGYDPNQSLSEGILQSAIAGLGVGAGGGALSSIGGKKTAKAVDNVQPDAPSDATGEATEFNLEEALNGQPIEAVVPVAQSLKQDVDAIRAGDMQNVDPATVEDLVNNEMAVANQDGSITLTNTGNQLVDEVDNLHNAIQPKSSLIQTSEKAQENNIDSAPQTGIEQNAIQQTIPQEQVEAVTPVNEDRISPVESQKSPEEIKQFQEEKLADLERQHDALPPESPLRAQIVEEMNALVSRNAIVQEADKAGLLKKTKELESIPVKKSKGVEEEATPEDEEEFIDYQLGKAANDIPFSVTKKTDSPEFKKWFGDSKVVDEKGEPMVVYHGTGAEFEEFSKSKATDKTGRKLGMGWGKDKFYFADSGEAASVSASAAEYYGKGTKQNVMPVHLKVENPISGKEYEDMIQKEQESGLSRDKAIAKIDKSLKRQGVDGIIGEFGGIAVFDPTQIKSATSNNGNYDPNDPRISYSTTPQFTKQKDQIKQKVTNIIKKINPSVNVKLMDKMFGEGESLKASGAKTADRQEVAGAYDRLRNLVYASMNTEKWNPEDTAYHEAFHSVFDMLSKADQAILSKAFPGNDSVSSEEQMAIEFARFMTEKNATGFTPAVRRIFLAIKQALRDIGRTLKLGKFNSVEDIFGRIESGKVYEEASKLKTALESGDIDSIGNTLAEGKLTQEQIENAVKELSPELHDIVYSKKPLNEEDRLNMLDMIADETGNLEDMAYSITQRVFSKIPNKEKMFKGVAAMLSPVMTKSQIETMQKNQATNLKNTKQEVKDKAKMNSGILWLRNLVQTNDGSLRYVASKYASKAIEKVADMFYHGAGLAKSVGTTYFEAIEDYVTTNMNKVGKALIGMNDKELDQVTEILQNPNTVHKVSDRVKKAALVLGNIIKEQRAYLEKAGLEIVSQIEGYFPRVYDLVKIVENTEGFLDAAVKAYQATYENLSNSDARGMANKWLNNILLQDQMGGYGTNNDDFHMLSDIPPAPDETKSRILTKEADDIMRDFLVRNPVDVMASSIGKAARAAEFERRFNKKNWEELKEQMREEGVDEEGMRQVMAAIKANVGMQNNTRGAVRNFNGLLRYWSNVMFLPRSAFSSLSEGFTVATKTGNPLDGLRNMYDGFRASLETKGSQAMRDMSDMYGITGEIADDMMMAQRTGGDFTSKKLSYKNKQFFKAVGLTGLTSGQLSATMKTGQFFIGKIADHIANNHNKKKSSEFLISELGIPKDKMDEFSKWITTNGGGKLDSEFGLGDTEMANLYRTALRRFVHTTIQVPTAATRQRYASTPLGQFVYGLTSYINAFSKNVLIRNGRILKEAATGSGYTAADRVALASQTMMMIPLMLLAAGVGELRDKIYKNPDAKEKSVRDHVMLGLSRGGAFGAFDPYVQLFQGLKYKKDPLNTFDGAFPSVVSSFIKAAGDLVVSNSENTNTTERNAAKQAYGLFAAPLMTSILATNNILPYPYNLLTYGAIQTVNSPQVKGKVMDKVAGKKKES